MKTQYLSKVLCLGSRDVAIRVSPHHRLSITRPRLTVGVLLHSIVCGRYVRYLAAEALVNASATDLEISVTKSPIIPQGTGCNTLEI